ncbi:hypothetical protein FQN57_004677 [Myotisia sp. PD_48]|nr:hypothetical protein FQN57_004677 [Myotisia sp. PD_48]
MPSPALKCNICPRKPNFSDVSHLLTHVSSKGHLSHYFKLQVRSHQEPKASQLLAAYDVWYEENNIAGLLSDRMLAKEAKTGRSQANKPNALPSAALSACSRSSSTKPTKPVGVTSKQRNSLPSFLDPRLSLPYNFGSNQGFQNNQSMIPTSSGGSMMPNTYSAPGFAWQPLQPPPQHLSSFASSSPMPSVWKHGAAPESDVDMSPLIQRNSRLNRRIKPPTASSNDVRPVTPDPFIDDASFEYYDEEEDMENPGGEEMTRLKGILWPGMAIFDSATEQMRRKRNQKKDGSILKQMEETSEKVEPTEQVFSPGGTLRKERLISGMVDDSSPLKGETPIPKKRVSRPRRQALGNLNPNAQMHETQNRYKMRLRRQVQAAQLEHLSRQVLPLLGDSPRRSNQGQCFGGMDSSMHMVLPPVDYQNQRAYSVFHDNGNIPTMRDDNRFKSNPRYHGSYYGSFQDPRAIEPYQGKENIDPLLTHMSAVQPQSGGGKWGAESRYNSQYTYGLQPKYRPFTGNDAFGYACNPLSYSNCDPSHGTDQKDRMKVENNDVFINANHDLGDGDLRLSPDGTVSDIGQEDVTQLYLNGLPE